MKYVTSNIYTRNGCLITGDFEKAQARHTHTQYVVLSFLVNSIKSASNGDLIEYGLVFIGAQGWLRVPPFELDDVIRSFIRVFVVRSPWLIIIPGYVIWIYPFVSQFYWGYPKHPSQPFALGKRKFCACIARVQIARDLSSVWIFGSALSVIRESLFLISDYISSFNIFAVRFEAFISFFLSLRKLGKTLY